MEIPIGMEINLMQRRRKEGEAARAANQMAGIGPALQRRRTDTQLSQSLSCIRREKILIIPTCCKLINSFYLLLKEPRKPSFDRGGWYLQKLKRSKVSDVADIREWFY